jgi:glycosyltransferase involved in cell wall biosynthesis
MHRYDVVHFNFGRTILPTQLRMLDLPLLRRTGVVIAVTFQGDDARRGDVARAHAGGASLPTTLPHLYPATMDAERRARVERFARYADLVYYLNPDLSYGLPARAQFLPYAHVDPRTLAPTARPTRDVPVVVHAPTDREVKGTRYVLKAVDRLRADGLDVELELVEGVLHEEAIRTYAHASLAVDQLLAGWYGGFAVEAMALGVPVVTYLRRDDLGVLPPAMREALPLIEATPDTLTDVLRTWLGTRREELTAVGRRSRKYIERWHDPLLIAARLAADYEAAVAQRTSGRRRAR